MLCWSCCNALIGASSCQQAAGLQYYALTWIGDMQACHTAVLPHGWHEHTHLASNQDWNALVCLPLCNKSAHLLLADNTADPNHNMLSWQAAVYFVVDAVIDIDAGHQACA